MDIDSDPPPSPPSTPPPSLSTLRAHALALNTHQRALEQTLSSLLTSLGAQNALPGTPLTDKDGFPRADIDDLPSVARDRQAVVRLRNDIALVQRRAGKALEKVFEKAGEEDQETDNNTPDNSLESSTNRSTDRPALIPFARIDGVAPGSPAADAGLRRTDLVLRIGTLTATSLAASITSDTVPNTATTNGNATTPLAPLAPLVAQHENRALELEILRTTNSETNASTRLTLTLIPRAGWGGRGLLGCHIVPYTPPASTIIS